MRNYPLLLVIILISCRSNLQLADYSPDDILMSIDTSKVTADEFIYSFNKSHQNEDSLSQSVINEYLQLFINYKLKVFEARGAGYDTATSYLNELSGYQEQLKSSYRASEKVIQDLKKEAYEMMKQEVSASHILIRLAENALPEDTVAAWQKIVNLRERASKEDFASLAQNFSEDPSSKLNKGYLGYFTAFQMVYPFEKAAYNTESGEVSEPVRTKFGYHIIKVHDKRPSAYKLKLFQVQLSGNTSEAKEQAHNKIFEVHDMLRKGLNPAQLVDFLDKEKFTLKTSSLPFLAYSQMPRKIYEIATQLTSPGEISDPVMLDSDWHIFILEDKMPLPPYEEMDKQLDRMVRKTERLENYQTQLMEQLFDKHAVNILVTSESISRVISDREDKVLFIINKEKYFIDDFLNYLKKKNTSLSDEKVISGAYYDYINEQVIKTEDQEIISENADLRWLLKEYEEGILLFNIMEDSVWNRAVQDKEGLEEFKVKKGQETITSANSSLSEVGGGTIVEYQQYLDEQWVQRLRLKYTVMVNQPVLDKIYKVILGNVGDKN